MTDSTNLVFHDIARFRTRIFDRLMRPHGLTTSQAWVIAHLVREDNQTQSALAARMGIGTVTLGGLIDRLETRGLVSRKMDVNDRRAKRVRLTDKAYPVHEMMLQSVALVDQIAYGGLSTSEQKQLADLVARVRANLSADLETRPVR